MRAKKNYRASRIEELENRELLDAAGVSDLVFDLGQSPLAYESGISAVNPSDIVRFDVGAANTTGFGDYSESAASSWTVEKRWFYCDYCETDADWDYNANDGRGAFVSNGPIATLLDRSAASGYNGMVWKCDAEYVAGNSHFEGLMKAVKAKADSLGIEIIPVIGATGYHSELAYDFNLAEGIPVENVPMTVNSSRTAATFDPSAVSVDSSLTVNGNLD